MRRKEREEFGPADLVDSYAKEELAMAALKRIRKLLPYASPAAREAYAEWAVELSEQLEEWRAACGQHI